MTTKPEAIATAEAGDRGQPGSSYAIIEAQIVRIAGDRFEARAKCSAGSNQGYLQEHDSMHARGRGDTPAAAIEQIRADVMAWNIAGIPVYERRNLLRELQYDAEDATKTDAEDATKTNDDSTEEVLDLLSRSVVALEKAKNGASPLLANNLGALIGRAEALWDAARREFNRPE
jgi:hypothetical protein